MIGILLAYEAGRWRQRATESAVDATIAGADAFVAASRRQHMAALRASLGCVVLASVSAFSGAVARGLDRVAAGQSEPKGGTTIINFNAPVVTGHPRRRAEDRDVN